MIKRYIVRQVDAVQYTGSNLDELLDLAGNDIYLTEGYVYLHTTEGDIRMVNKTGDYLVKNNVGKFYFSEKQEFESTYQEYALAVKEIGENIFNSIVDAVIERVKQLIPDPDPDLSSTAEISV